MKFIVLFLLPAVTIFGFVGSVRAIYKRDLEEAFVLAGASAVAGGIDLIFIQTFHGLLF